MNKKLRELLNAQNALINKALKENRALTDEENAEVERLEGEIEACRKRIELEAKLKKNTDEEEEIEKEEKTPVTDKIFAQPKASSTGIRPFKNFVEQLKAVKDAATSGRVDERLAKLNTEFKNAALGMNEGVDSDGGFAVQGDFAGMLMETAATAGNILPLVDSYSISGGANRVEWNDLDETDVSTTVFGGVQVYWAAEAAAVNASAPKLVERELKLEKLMGFAYDTYELNADSSFVDGLYTKAFTVGIQRTLEAAIIAGNGVGKPLGFQAGNNAVSVAKESGQSAATILWENIVKMYNRALNKQKGIWLMHPDCSEQLDFMAFPLGVGGVPVYLQASAVGSVPSLKGRPIVESDHCAALGTVGDINFVDLSEYLLIYKGGIDMATSMHVQFLTAQNCFRFIFRANGMPKKRSSLTIKNSSNTRSSFVTLATRS
jgi:HK97 family phage major capsid protein